MANALKAGVLYFLGVFTLGFILGVIRIFFLVPHTGPMVAVLIELPVILFFSWVFCRFLTRRFAVPAEPYERLIMGLIAFSCLMIGEALVAVFLQQGRMTDFFMTFDLPENRIGLGGQIAFALFPVLQSYADSKAGR